MDTIQDYNRKLEFQVAELGSNSSSKTMQRSERNTLIHEIYKNRNNMNDLLKHQETQCDIISLQEYQHYEQFIQNIPQLIDKALRNICNTTLLT
jgi:flagellar biosynthesis chaperone FliJ